MPFSRENSGQGGQSISKKQKKKEGESGKKSFRKNKSSANKDMRLVVQTRKRVKGSLLRAVCLFSRSSSSRPSSFTLQQPNTQNWLDRVPIGKWLSIWSTSFFSFVNTVNFILHPSSFNNWSTQNWQARSLALAKLLYAFRHSMQ